MLVGSACKPRVTRLKMRTRGYFQEKSHRYRCMNFMLSVSCVQRSFFFFAYFLIHRWGCLIRSLKSIGVIITWINSVCFGMYSLVWFVCVCVCVCAPGNDFLRLDLEELFWQIYIRCPCCARHSEYREPASWDPELSIHLSLVKGYPAVHSFIHSIKKYLISTHVCQAWL